MGKTQTKETRILPIPHMALSLITNAKHNVKSQNQEKNCLFLHFYKVSSKINVYLSYLSSPSDLFDKQQKTTIFTMKNHLDKMSSKEEIVQGFQQLCQMQRYVEI